jgi:hypothetical protein
MKKILILAGVLALIASLPVFAQSMTTNPVPGTVTHAFV